MTERRASSAAKCSNELNPSCASRGVGTKRSNGIESRYKHLVRADPSVRRNVLITSAGRRGKLVAAFQRELAASCPGGKVFAADADPQLSVACHVADAAFAVPRLDDVAFLPTLTDLCSHHEIGLVVPTIDTELLLLAQHREAFAARGVAVVVSEEPFIQLTRDKRATATWFVERGLQVPATIDVRVAPRFPLFARPYNGSCSRNTAVIRDASQLTNALRADEAMLFSEYLSPDDYDEYSVDMYYSGDGELRCAVPRLRIETRQGEVSKSRTARIAAGHMLRERFSRIAGARGCITLQMFVNRPTGSAYGIEINARFGGGYPLSYEAGANFPRWLIEEYLLGRPIDFFDDWERDLTMLRYDEHVLVRSAAA